jgi:hypothetical protein
MLKTDIIYLRRIMKRCIIVYFSFSLISILMDILPKIFYSKDYFTHSNIQLLIIMTFLVVLFTIVYFLNQKIYKIKCDSETLGELKFIYRVDIQYWCVIEFQIHGEFYSKNLTLSTKIGNEIIKKFPQKKMLSYRKKLSDTEYSENAKYKKWLEELPYDFNYPKITILYNNEKPEKYLKIVEKRGEGFSKKE